MGAKEGTGMIRKRAGLGDRAVPSLPGSYYIGITIR